MDVFIYSADLFCEDCGRAIIDRLTAEGKAPANPDDECSFDSDKFPKGPYPDGGGEADCAQHCGSGEDCVNAVELTGEDGKPFKIGAHLENDLTSHGVEWLNEHIRDDPFSPVVELWQRFYSDIYNGILPLPADLPEPYFDRFDIAEAYAVLEMDWNSGGILQERPRNSPCPFDDDSEPRRPMSVGYQLSRMGVRLRDLSYDKLEENAKAIYHAAELRLGLRKRVNA